jgi:hypothetical protein
VAEPSYPPTDVLVRCITCKSSGPKLDQGFASDAKKHRRPPSGDAALLLNKPKKAEKCVEIAGIFQ